MDKAEIEVLREKLNEMLENLDYDSQEVLELSRELDKLIMRYIEGLSDKSDNN